eukprot:Gb_11863 [translate_table: standard]
MTSCANRYQVKREKEYSNLCRCGFDALVSSVTLGRL